MAATIFITGGARSGKSRLAEGLALAYGAPLGYLATGMAGDAEMAERIARHQARRGPAWTTIEEPLDLAGAIRAHEGSVKALLVDCVTLWLTNLLLKHGDGAKARGAKTRGLSPLRPCPEPMRVPTPARGRA